MNYETFKTAATASIQKYFGADATVSLQPVIKNNNVRLDGLTILNGNSNISPTIYLNHYYKDYLSGKPLSSVIDDIIETYRENLPKESMDFSFFTDYDKVKCNIIYKLIHYERNKKLLECVPYFRYLDLAVVFCCFLPNTPNGNATILIHNNHLDFWNITKDTLYGLAIKNTPMLLPYDLKSMEDTLKFLCPELFAKDGSANADAEIPAMYVLSNTEKLYGASAVFYPNVLSDFASLIGSDFYILPSSIHEVLLLPKEPHSRASDLDCIIQDVNSAHVLKEEILSDHAYLFERARGLMTFQQSES